MATKKITSKSAMQEVADADTAAKILRAHRVSLGVAVGEVDAANLRLIGLIVDARPKGVVTVDQMAQAIDRDRSYIDSVWSVHGTVTKQRQTRAPVPENVDEGEAERVLAELKQAASILTCARDNVDTEMAARNRAVTIVYASKRLGPGAISKEAGISRNHVLRIARANGVAPVHRKGVKNQYTRNA